MQITMQNHPTTPHYQSLPVADRIALVGEIWDSIAQDTPSGFALTVEQAQEIERRYAAHEAQPATSIPWDEALTMLLEPSR